MIKKDEIKLLSFCLSIFILAKVCLSEKLRNIPKKTVTNLSYEEYIEDIMLAHQSNVALNKIKMHIFFYPLKD